jgi:lipopolysaccharide cholinephosphotransferase
MKEYDDATLKKVQQAELGILKDFVKLCDENDITYFGIAGTGIGALRHKGFIPWDDDIDVAMPREDHERFVKIAKEKYSDKYYVLNGVEDENYPLLTTRWILKGTTFIEEPLKNINCNFGIFLDIYPLDKIPDDEKLFKKQARKAFFFSKLLVLRSIPFPVLAFSGVKAKLVHAICAVVHFFLALFHVSKKWLHKKCLAVSTMYNSLPESKRIDFLCDTTAYMNIHYTDGMYPLIELDFEDIKLKFPGNIRDNLTSAYGDYMKLPPVEKRKNHYPYKLDFGDGK